MITIKAQQIIQQADSKGIKLQLNNGNIKCEAPKEFITQEFISALKENKAEVIEVLKQLQDPRSDLEEDSKLWALLLKTAYAYDEMTHGTLHGFRCGGAKLELEKGRLELKPRYGPDTDYSWQTEKGWFRDRKEWLLPLAEEIKEVFTKTSKELKQNVSSTEQTTLPLYENRT
ncbi:hypothetical protein [Fuchsiella alkaliacetigena]|uniref:TubC N-terminal docking domain-related protein n=1 Tax=Fuchsiella alkaliacetigena TaxID=957042 RepID=UPI00200B184B|nr:hypothetical protein [Fuchsiella alkaliacetigena]MCK8823994.1 hypothetical protein [Fuchsiella alkaliacetigena]